MFALYAHIFCTHGKILSANHCQKNFVSIHEIYLFMDIYGSQKNFLAYIYILTAYQTLGENKLKYTE